MMDAIIITLSALLFGFGLMATFVGYLVRWLGPPSESRVDPSADVLRATIRASYYLVRFGPPALGVGLVSLALVRLFII